VHQKMTNPFNALLAISALAASLMLSIRMIERALTFHPVFQAAHWIQIPRFEPSPQSPDRWTRMTLFTLRAQIPKLLSQERYWVFLPYSKGPPARYPSQILVRSIDSEDHLAIFAPRTLEKSADDAFDWKPCLLSNWSVLNSRCRRWRRALVERHARDFDFGSERPIRWQLQGFDAPEARGIGISAVSESEAQERWIDLSDDGKERVFHWRSRAAVTPLAATPAPEGEVLDSQTPWAPRASPLHPVLVAVLGSLEELSQQQNPIGSNPPAPEAQERWSQLVSQIGQRPAPSEPYAELAQLALEILEQSQHEPGSETLRWLIRAQADSARRYLKDLRPGDPLPEQIETRIREILRRPPKPLTDQLRGPRVRAQ
jgi:hypothetical protein